MIFNKHSRFEGQHAFLGASKYHWLNYTPEKLEAAYAKHNAAQKGTELHALAAKAITLGVKLDPSSTVGLYVNDAIEYGLLPEQVLYFSENAFGTADAINFENGVLRIHDLKTGETPILHPSQLEIYEALFCLEYGVDPKKIDAELRFYQGARYISHTPNPDDIMMIMGKIIDFDRRIELMKIGR